MQRLLFYFWLLAGAAAVRADTVLVLPFFNLSNNPNLTWIGESISETVREALASEKILVLDREDREEAFRRLAMRSGGLMTHASVIKIGQTLDAGRIVYGQFELRPPEGGAPSRGSLRITARILDLKRLRQGPEFVEIGALEDLAALERHLAWQSLQFLAPQSAPSEEEFRKNHPVVRVDAIENYIRGLMASSPEQKHRFFTQAARLDPGFSQPRYQLGRMYVARKDWRVASGWLEGVGRGDSHYLESRFWLGVSRYQNGDFAGAETAFQEVAQAMPLNEVFNNLGVAQSRRNEPAALGNFRRALEGDNSDPDYHFNVGYALWKRGDFAGAAARFRAVLERTPEDADAIAMLGRALQKSGPRPGDPKSDGLERLKLNYEETAYRQLKAVLEPGK
jgi:tetratricopeptide (TPR) repeat protein